MKSILKATAILGSSSVASIIIGIATQKSWAIFVGPTGVGLMGLQVSLLSIASIIAGFGVSMGLVRLAAPKLANDDLQGVAALHKASWILLAILGILTFLTLIIFRAHWAGTILGQSELTGNVILTAVAVVINLAVGVQMGMLNAYHRIHALARIGVLNSAFGAVVSISLIWLFRQHGIGLALLGSYAANVIVTSYFTRKEIQLSQVTPTREQVIDALKSLIIFGGPFTLSMLVSNGIVNYIPVMALHQLGPESVGYYRAASSITVAYLSFLLTAMTQDYYPRVSAANGHPETLNAMVNEQHRLVLLFSAPMILGLLALTPILVPMLYSTKFTPAINILEWQLIGDFFKFTSWTMAIVILACCSSITYLTIEAVSGALMLAGVWYGMQRFGLEGLGMSFLAIYIVYYIIVTLVLRRKIALRWSTANLRLFTCILCCLIGIRTLPFLGLERYRLYIALPIAGIFGWYSLNVFMKEYRGKQTHDTAILQGNNSATSSHV